jgi:hypothetical protein
MGPAFRSERSLPVLAIIAPTVPFTDAEQRALHDWVATAFAEDPEMLLSLRVAPRRLILSAPEDLCLPEASVAEAAAQKAGEVIGRPLETAADREILLRPDDMVRHALDKLCSAIRGADARGDHTEALVELIGRIEELCVALAFAGDVDPDVASAVTAACEELAATGDAA